VNNILRDSLGQNSLLPSNLTNNAPVLACCDESIISFESLLGVHLVVSEKQRINEKRNTIKIIEDIGIQARREMLSRLSSLNNLCPLLLCLIGELIYIST
jgi:hypothetical protein